MGLNTLSCYGDRAPETLPKINLNCYRINKNSTHYSWLIVLNIRQLKQLISCKYFMVKKNTYSAADSTCVSYLLSSHVQREDFSVSGFILHGILVHVVRQVEYIANNKPWCWPRGKTWGAHLKCMLRDILDLLNHTNSKSLLKFMSIWFNPLRRDPSQLYAVICVMTRGIAGSQVTLCGECIQVQYVLMSEL